MILLANTVIDLDFVITMIFTLYSQPLWYVSLADIPLDLFLRDCNTRAL